MVPSRRRQRLVLAAAVLATASTQSAAFSPPSAGSAAFHSAASSDDQSSRKQKRLKPPKGPLGVSFLDRIELEAPSTTSTPRKRRGPPHGSGRVVRTGPARKGGTVEIDLQDFLDLDGYVASPPKSDRTERSNDNGSSYEAAQMNRPAPAIDSEIMLTRKYTRRSVSQPKASSAKEGVATKSVPPKSKVQQSTGKKRGSRSSTMPGFVKDKGLDAHILSLDLARIPNRSKLTRSVNTKKAKLKRRQTNSALMYKKSSAVPDSLLDYTKEIHTVDRVTPKEEKELGTKTQEALRLKQLHDDLKDKYGREPSDDEWCAAAGKLNIVALQEAIEDGMQAKNMLVASNLRMVQRVVNLYIRNGLGSEYDAGDLMQDGTMALIRAAEKYEPERGFRFSTYAMYWIRSAVKRSQTSQSRIVTVPQRVHETHKRVQRNESQLRKELGRDPTKAELAEACDISVTQLERCRRAMGQVTFSLDAELENTRKPQSGDKRKDTMYDIVEGQVDETEYEKTQRLLMKEHLITTMRKYLSPHEVDLLLLRYGLMDERALPEGTSGPLTIAEVSRLVGLKPDKVRRIIINSQKQLKHLMKEWENFELELA